MNVHASEIETFEKACDRSMARLELWEKPLRSVLTGYLMMADSLIFGGRFGRNIERDQYKAERIIARLSYLTPYLDRCPRDLLKSGREAMEKFKKSDGQEIQEALMYAHFCELMPEFRQKYYDVKPTGEIFEFEHQSDSFASSEVKDVILTELCLGFDTQKPQPIPVELFSRISIQYPHKDVATYVEGASVNYDMHCSSFCEPTYIPDEAFVASFGFDRESFTKTRAALWSLADLLLGLSSYYEMSSELEENKDVWQWKVIDCIAPTFRRDWLLSFVCELTGLISADADEVLNFLVACEKESLSKCSGNGYLQPIFQLGNFLLTSPLLLRMMPSLRNMLYALNKADPDLFSKSVAHHLETELLNELSALCERNPELSIKKNLKWSFEGKDGEVDAVLYDSQSKFFLVLQAKAAIPPEGARMTRNVQSRTIEALCQIESFGNLSRANQEVFFRDTVGQVDENFEVAHGIITRSGLGTDKAWQAVKDVAVMNVGLLGYTLHETGATSADFLGDPVKFLSNAIDDLVSHHFIGWEQGIVSLFDRKLHIPLMKLNNEKLQELRFRIAQI